MNPLSLNLLIANSTAVSSLDLWDSIHPYLTDNLHILLQNYSRHPQLLWPHVGNDVLLSSWHFTALFTIFQYCIFPLSSKMLTESQRDGNNSLFRSEHSFTAYSWHLVQVWYLYSPLFAGKRILWVIMILFLKIFYKKFTCSSILVKPNEANNLTRQMDFKVCH